MTKFDWSKARRVTTDPRRDALERGADRSPYNSDKLLRKTRKKLSPAQKIIKKLGPYKPGTYQDRDGIWITVGPDCPWNTTPGIRQVHHFKNRKEAQDAGFT